MEKLTLEQFGQVMIDTLGEVNMYPYLRLGQALFNTVYIGYPDLANSLRGTGADCFIMTLKSFTLLMLFWHEI